MIVNILLINNSGPTTVNQTGDWILGTGFWDDSKTWDDNENWID